MSLPHYLFGVAQLLFLAACALLAATSLRSRLLPSFSGAPSVLATTVLSLAFLVLTAEALGTFGLLSRWAYLASAGILGVGIHLALGGPWGGPSSEAASRFSPPKPRRSAAAAPGEKPSKQEGPPRGPLAPPMVIALSIAALALAKFALETKPALSTGMTGFDTTWYHAPFAAGFFQTADTWSLHLIAPQFLAWFYPANSELFHAVGMIAFERDLLSPLLNLGWLAACLLTCWCVGRPYGVAPWSLALGAIALSVPAFADQAGEARNDVVGAFLLLASVAIALNARRGGPAEGGRTGLPFGAILVAALAAGLAAGTKLNFLLPAAVLVVGLAWLAGPGRRVRGHPVSLGAALLGGGYWYLRNLAHSGNPLPWIDSLGPIDLPAPDQALGGREGHSVLSYLTDATVWSDWLLPGLRDGLTILWPLLLALTLAAILLSTFRCSFARHGSDKEQRNGGRGVDPGLRVAGLAALAALLAWLVAPTSASGPEGVPRGFESGLRYLVPALVLSLAILPPALLPRVARWRGSPIAEGAEGVRAHGGGHRDRTRGPLAHTGPLALAGVAAVLFITVALGYPLQRHYLEHRYANPSFAAPGLNAAFAWSSDLNDSSVATTSTRQYPLYGPDLSNRVQFVGEQRPHGGFVAPADCPTWRRLLNEGDYDYTVTSRDRLEPGKPAYPETTHWTESPGATAILRQPPTTVFRLSQPLPPSGCGGPATP